MVKEINIGFKRLPPLPSPVLLAFRTKTINNPQSSGYPIANNYLVNGLKDSKVE